MPCRLYGFGSNSSGQLGVNHTEDLNSPQPCLFSSDSDTDDQHGQLSPALPDDSDAIRKIVAGGNHTLILTRKGRVYAAGENRDGRCGIPSNGRKERLLVVFEEVKWARERRVTDVAATWEASVFVEDGRKVRSCGSGSKGELGLGSRGRKMCLATEEPTLVLDVDSLATGGNDGCTVVAISASMSHVIVLLSNGDVYGWGACRKGQLGYAVCPEKVVWIPRRIDLDINDVEAVHSGRDCSVFISRTGKTAFFGELNGLEDSKFPGKFANGTRLVAGWSTIYVTDADQKLGGYGSGRRGQLPPQELPRLSAIAAGSEHCLAITEDSSVITWGWGEHGNCGFPLDDRSCVSDRFNTIFIPLHDGYKIEDMAAGCATSFVWTIKDG